MPHRAPKIYKLDLQPVLLLELQLDLQPILFLLKSELDMGLGTPLSFFLNASTTIFSSFVSLSPSLPIFLSLLFSCGANKWAQGLVSLDKKR